MAKAKASKAKNVPNKHIHARLSFLHQASSYLSLAQQGERSRGGESAVISVGESTARDNLDHAQSRHLLSQLRAVALKSQTRLNPQVKHTLCKRCNSLLIAGKTSTETIVNASKGGKKPQGDVMLVRCEFCGSEKRFPVGQSRGVKPAVTGQDNRLQDVKARVSQNAV